MAQWGTRSARSRTTCSAATCVRHAPQQRFARTARPTSGRQHCVSTPERGQGRRLLEFQRSSCGSGAGPTNQTTSGTSLIWTSATSDATLLEFGTAPNSAYNTHLAGFSAATTAPDRRDLHPPPVRRLQEDQPREREPDDHVLPRHGFAGDSTHWRVIDWDSGTTEGGSSDPGSEQLQPSAGRPAPRGLRALRQQRLRLVWPLPHLLGKRGEHLPRSGKHRPELRHGMDLSSCGSCTRRPPPPD